MSDGEGMYFWQFCVRIQAVSSQSSPASYSMHMLGVVSSGGAPTPAGTSVFTKHNWDMGMGYLWLNGWGIYHLMGGAFMA